MPKLYVMEPGTKECPRFTKGDRVATFVAGELPRLGTVTHQPHQTKTVQVLLDGNTYRVAVPQDAAMTLRRDFEDAIVQQNSWPRDWWPMGAHWNAEVWPQYHFYEGGNCVSCNMYWAVGLECPHHEDAGRE